MGLMTLLTGKPRLLRQVESREKKLDKQLTPLLLQGKDELQIKDGRDFVLELSSWKIGLTVNEFVTHWVRSTLDIHPKSLTESNFKSESPILAAHLMMLLYAIDKTEGSETPVLDIFSRALLFTTPDPSGSAPTVETLLRDMFKSCPLEMLLLDERYKEEAQRGLQLLENSCENFVIHSDLPHDLQLVKGLIAMFKLRAETGKL